MPAYPIRITGRAEERLVSAVELQELMSRYPNGEVPVEALLDLTTIEPSARRVHVTSDDGSYSASIPLDEARRGGVLTSEPEGNRLRVLEGRTLCWNVKDVAELRLTVAMEPDNVPENPTH